LGGRHEERHREQRSPASANSSALWKTIYNWPSFPADGSHWDRLFKGGDRFRIGDLNARVLLSHGQTLDTGGKVQLGQLCKATDICASC